MTTYPFAPIDAAPKSKTAVPPIPVKETIRAARQLGKAEWGALFKIAALPCLVIAVAGISPSKTPSSPGDAQSILDYMQSVIRVAGSGGVTGGLISFLIASILTPWMNVAGLRYLILGERSEVVWPNYNSRMWRYLWKSIVVGFLAIIFVGGCTVLSFIMLPKIIAAIVSLILFLFSLIISTPIFLSFTAVAVGGDASFRSSWKKTHGQVLRISAIEFSAGLKILLITLAVGVLEFLINHVLGDAFHPFVRGLVVWITSVSTVVVWLPVNALLYAHFYQQKNSPPGQS